MSNVKLNARRKLLDIVNRAHAVLAEAADVVEQPEVEASPAFAYVGGHLGSAKAILDRTYDVLHRVGDANEIGQPNGL